MNDPKGKNIHGGGGYYPATEVENETDVWEINYPFHFKKCTRQGIYNVTHISVSNAGYKHSDVWNATEILLNVSTPECESDGDYLEIMNMTVEPSIITQQGKFKIKVN